MSSYTSVEQGKLLPRQCGSGYNFWSPVILQNKYLENKTFSLLFCILFNKNWILSEFICDQPFMSFNKWGMKISMTEYVI